MKNIAEKSTKLNILYTLLYGIFTLIVVLSHEIWADEAQVWQIVQNVSFLGLFKHLVNEGPFVVLSYKYAVCKSRIQCSVYADILLVVYNCECVFALAVCSV